MKQRNTVLFIAMSLDGYIADANGGVDWLEGQNPEEGDGNSYDNFIREIDTVVMGWNTYRQIATELSPQQWVYEGLTSYVLTHRKIEKMDGIIFTDESPCGLIQRLRRKPGKDIWICGGASTAGQLMKEGMIDRYHISIIPTLLGSGIRLFDSLKGQTKLKLVRNQVYNGIAELVYERR